MEDMLKGRVKHFNAFIDLDLLAPCLCVPEDVFDNETRFLKLNLGRVVVKSDCHKHNPELKYSDITDENILYDKYFLELKDVSLILQEKHFLHNLVTGVQANAVAKVCHDPLHPTAATIKTELEIAKTGLVVELRHGFHILKALIQIKDKILT
jgi:hypothetical protein